MARLIGKQRIGRRTITFDISSIFDFPLVQKDIKFKSWLSTFDDASRRSAGVSIRTDIKNIQTFRRWFLAGVAPFDAVKRHQKLGFKR